MVVNDDMEWVWNEAVWPSSGNTQLFLWWECGKLLKTF